MTMTIDSTQHRFPLNFDHMSSYSTNQPQFTNPWVSSSSTAPHAASGSHGMYVGSQGGLNPNLSLETMKHQQASQQQQQQPPPPQHQQPPPVSRAGPSSSAAPMASYGGSIPVTAASADLLSINRLPHTSGATYADAAYTTAASPIHSTYAASPTPYDQLGYAPAPMRSTFAMAPEDQRRYSQSSVASSSSSSALLDSELAPSPHRNPLVDTHTYRGMQNDDRRSFADAIEASHGILSLSQETPRPIYGSRTRGSGDSYGFPSTHSTSSSVSSTGFSGYYGGSVDSSVSDYSTAGSDIESVTSRTLPRPQGLMSSQAPPAPQSMMSQFSSKVSSSTQKKHKCKVCDKRFTRPSSLQTHMYSHTGEKPFSCEVEGCGRHFSVVSNLRRHRKVHKGQAPSEAGSEDHHSD